MVLETVIDGRPGHRSAKRPFVNVVLAGCVDGSDISGVWLRCGHAQQLILGIAANIAVGISVDGAISAVEAVYLPAPRRTVGSIAIHAAGSRKLAGPRGDGGIQGEVSCV